jgi:iron(III) transport system permease protein
LTAFHLLGAGGWLGSTASPHWLFAMPGCVLVLTVSFVPVVTVLTWLGARSTDATGDEAARLIAGSWKSLWRVVLPQATPSIALAAIVVFTLALIEVAVPMFLRVDVYSAAVFSRLGGFAFAPGEAAVLAIPLAVFSFVLWALERSSPAHRVVALLVARDTAVPLIDGRGSKVLSSLAAVLVAGIGIAPVTLMIVAASRGDGFALLDTYAGDTILNSVLYAASVSTVTVVLATLIMSVAREFPRLVGSIDAIAWLAFLLPPALFAIGAIGFWNRPTMQWLYGSAGIMILALSARYAVLAIRIVLSGQQQLSPSLDEAARTLGATYWQRLTRIQLPGLRRFAVGAWLLVFVFCLRDIETTALLYPPGGEPITVRLFTLEANGPPAVIAALAVVLALMTVAPFALASLLLRRPA